MPAGDPMWTCRKCGRTYFSNIQSFCDSCFEHRDGELNYVYDHYFGDGHMPWPPPPAPHMTVSDNELNSLYEEIVEDKAQRSIHDTVQDVIERIRRNKKKEKYDSVSSTSDKKTLVVNIFAGPGAGKSTMAAGIFFELKTRGINCEMATEFAKDLTWEERHDTFKDQIYIFGKQYHRIFRLLGKVDVIITDSPLLLTPIYDKEHRKPLRDLAIFEHDMMWTYNVFLNRKKAFNSKGRNQNEEEARILDKNILNQLDEIEECYEVFEGTPEGKNRIVDKILMLLEYNTNK